MLTKNYPTNSLIVLPTFRAIREQLSIATDGFLPKFTTLEEFFKSARFVQNRQKASGVIRKLLLRKAAVGISGTVELGFESEFLRFLRNSDFLFRFFDEMISEEVKFANLIVSDTYAKFEDHLSVLENVWQKYCELLDKNGLYDNSYPAEFVVNNSYVNSFDDISFYLGGYTTKKELRIISEVAKLKPVKTVVTISAHNEKMCERLKESGFLIEDFGIYELDWNTKETKYTPNSAICSDLKTICVSRKIDQAVLAQDIAFGWVNSGFKAEKIAIVTADESFASSLKLLDEKRNLNFAMGLQDYNAINRLLALLDSDKTKLQMLNLVLPNSVQELFDMLNEPIYQDAINIAKEALRFDTTLSWREVAHIIVSELSSIDDVGGGKLTVMGLLETRGAEFDGVVFLDFDASFAPKPSQKDLFLTTDIKKKAGLPTRKDREGLQAFYYEEALRHTKQAVFVYSGQPSPFIQTFGLPEATIINNASSLKFSKPKVIEKYDIEKQEINLKSIIWSHTKLKTFLSCKRKFYYRYIKDLKESDPLAKDSVSQKLGEKFHSVIAKNPNANKKELIRAMLENEKSEALRAEIRKLSFALDKFCQVQSKFLKDGWKSEFLEQKFGAQICGFNFVAFIDRVDIKSASFNIIDYKLGSGVKIDNPKDSAKRIDFQLPIYAASLWQSKARDVSLDSFLANTNAFLWAVGDEALICEPDLKASINLLEERLKDLNEIESEFELCDGFAPCRYCDYQILCERNI